MDSIMHGVFTCLSGPLLCMACRVLSDVDNAH